MTKIDHTELPAIGAPFEGGFYAGKFFGADGASKRRR